MTDPKLPFDPDVFNAVMTGYCRTLGIRVTHASVEAVEVALDVSPAICQPYGLVHGGIYAGMIETAASCGAAIHAFPQPVVGLDNTTSFLSAVREGRLVCRATPRKIGKRSHLWAADVRVGERLVATGQVRMLVLEAGAEAAGGRLTVPDGGGAPGGSA